MKITFTLKEEKIELEGSFEELVELEKQFIENCKEEGDTIEEFFRRH